MRLPALLLTALLPLVVAPAAAQPKPADVPLRVHVPPPLEWNRRTLVTRPGLSQTPYDLGRINGDVMFGMTPEQLVPVIPGLPSALTWNDLRAAREYGTDVRFFWLKLDDLPVWRKLTSACVGNSSYVAFLFVRELLFRISFRLIPDRDCPSVTNAALDLFDHYMAIDPTIALSVHYRAQAAEVVDITDPKQSALIPIRWRMSGT